MKDFAAVELWNYQNVLAEALDYGSSPTAITNQYLAWDRYCTFVVQTPRVERRICLELIRPIVPPEPREGDHAQSVM